MDNVKKDFSISFQEIEEIINTSSQTNPKDLLRTLNSKGGLKYFEKVLKSNIEKGISGTEIDKAVRIKNFGDNYDFENPPKGFCHFICEVLGDTFLRILILCAIVQISIGASPLSENPDKDWIDGLGIVFAIVIVVLTASITNYKKENEFRKLSNINNSKSLVTVLRNNDQINLHYSELLVGDIVKLSQGMVIPADGIIIQSDELKIDESSLTGESNMIKKYNLESCFKIMEKNYISEDSVNNMSKNSLNKGNESCFKTKALSNKIPLPLVFSSTLVNSGHGIFMVLAVGKNSTKGKLQMAILQDGDKEESKTPLELKLEDVAADIGKFGMFAALFTFIALLLKFLNSKYQEYQFHSKILQNHLSNFTSIDIPDKNAYYSNDNIFLGNNTENNGNYAIPNISNLAGNYNSTFNLTNSDHLVNPYKIFEGAYKEIFTMLILCITIIVVAIPEGLPLAVTLALSFSVSKMMKVNNLVRNISACEVVGGANYICTDKTGTLTKNKLELNGFILHDHIFEKRNNNSHQNIQLIKSQVGENYFSLLLNSILLNIDIVLNNKFEISHGLELDRSAFEFFLNNHKEETYKIITESKNIIHDRINFNSIRKKITTIIKLGNGKFRVYSKGAAEYILDVSSHFVNYRKKSTDVLNDPNRKLINMNVEKFASLSYRIIGLAYKDVSDAEIKNFREFNPDEQTDNYAFEKNGFNFLGLLCFKDGIRTGVPEAVIKCKNAGINVIMVTGDNPTSAVAIAQDCNILAPLNTFNKKEYEFNNSLNVINKQSQKNFQNESGSDILNEHINNINNNCITGLEFYTKIGGLNCETCSLQVENCKCPVTEKDAESAGIPVDKIRKEKIGSLNSFKQIIKNYKVFARTRPLDKYCLVKGLKELDHVVAVTGDGTNDAMALSKSDVGFSMGINGTDIAKDASDIILLDDNFASIVNAIKWGRGIFDNIRKFIQFQLSVNISAVLLVFFSSCVGSESPITAIQMLWLNMIMDSLGSLCLATEDPNDDLLNRKPYSKREYIINPRMWKHIIFQAIFQFTIIFMLYLYAPSFIKENNTERVFINHQLENCFGKINPLKIRFEHHKIIHYILDGKKSMWDPLKLIKRNLDKDFCFFYDMDKFEKGKIKNLKEAYKWIISEYGNSVHMTIIFNTFVLYALFNQINSRILDDSLNVFANLHQNFTFIFIIIIEILIQFSIVQYGGVIFNCVKGGLTRDQWIICISFSLVSLIVSLFLKCTRLEKIFEINYLNKIKSFFYREENNFEKEQLVEMVENSDDYLEK